MYEEPPCKVATSQHSTGQPVGCDCRPFHFSGCIATILVGDGPAPYQP
jgi:hypothetical protein